MESYKEMTNAMADCVKETNTTKTIRTQVHWKLMRSIFLFGLMVLFLVWLQTPSGMKVQIYLRQ